MSSRGRPSTRRTTRSQSFSDRDKDGKLVYQNIPHWKGKCHPAEAFNSSHCNQKVIELHPLSDGKPCTIGNCQAGWAIMMLAAVRPDLFGPIIDLFQ